MAEYTPNLNLLKKDPIADANDTFNIEIMLNENWDKIDADKKAQDEAIAAAETNAKAYTDVHEEKAAPHSGHETPEGAQEKADAALNSAKQYTDQEVAEVSQALAAHKADNTIHKTSDVIRTETNTQLKVEVVSSSVSETPDAGRIIFDTSQGKFFGGNGTEWV